MRSFMCRAAGPALFLSALASVPAHADDFVQRPPHEHGRVTVNVALEGTQLTIELDSPAINVVGFEHTPRSAAELAAVRQAERLLRSGKDLVGTPPAAACTFKEAQLQTPHWEDDTAGGDAGHGEHADYGVQLTYRCGAPAQLTWIEPWLIDRLEHVVAARINLVSTAGQRSQTVGGGHVRVTLP